VSGSEHDAVPAMPDNVVTEAGLAAVRAPHDSVVVAARWAFAWAVLFVAMHVYWELGGSIGFGDAAEPTPDGPSSLAGWIFNVVVGGMFTLGLLTPLALVQSWGRRVPRRLVVFLMWAGAALLVARGGSGLLDGALRGLGIAENGLTGLSYEQSIGTARPSAYTVWSLSTIEAYFLAGGLLFGRAARRAGRRRPTDPARSRPRTRTD
jgi:hypothetical protein